MEGYIWVQLPTRAPLKHLPTVRSVQFYVVIITSKCCDCCCHSAFGDKVYHLKV